MAFVVTFYDQEMNPVRQDQVELEQVYHLIVPPLPGVVSRMAFYYSIDIDMSEVEAPEPQEAGHAG